ncbi:C4-dicarboxylate TRAP transporter substrate-binding protein [uncultured Hydrogenophaga sp.]|uniref:C4-dicarboxylate TRAP transporter substrate-binding protein n=1 Tax=uncultured Hydrogenophaga sp. TaxID=199683 RepID=UPI00258AE0BA|nr:C4-dicarboxylate TRAP transporter substrate-binding protein [uncultured Hydrogenophaga sp.]
MKPIFKLRTLGLFAIGVLAAGGALGQQDIKLTIGSHAGTTLVPVATMKNYYQAEVNRLLQTGGNKYKVTWNEAYGGTLFKFSETLSAVKDGLADVGYVGTVWEADRMPLSGITFFTPFSSTSMKVQANAVDNLVRNNKAVADEWERNNLVYLAPIVVENYDLWTSFPVGKLDDLKGRKLMAPGTAARWLQGTGAVAVDGGLPAFYTNIQTGVADGAVSLHSAMMGMKIFEVAKHVTETGIGSMVPGALAVNRDRFRKLPKEVQDALVKAASGYSDRVIQETELKIADARKALDAQGSKVQTLPEAERKRWIASLPDIGGDWIKLVEAKGQPARQVMQAYMAEVRKAGEKPGRDWDR